MKLIERLLPGTEKTRDFHVIEARPGGPQHLFVAIEVFVHEKDVAATCIVRVDLASLAVELVHEARGSSVAYAQRDGWHGLVQRDALIEIGEAGSVTKTPAASTLGKGGALAAIARTGTTTLVSGVKRAGKYANDGFVARAANGKLAMLLETSTQPGCDQGGLAALAVGASGTIHAVGSASADGRLLLFSGALGGSGGAKSAVTATPVSDNDLYTVHATPDGHLLIGGRATAAVVRDGEVQTLAGVVGRVRGVTTFRGTDYWMSHDEVDHLAVSKRAGDKLARKWRTKFHYIGYRGLDGAPDARMSASDDWLVVTNRDRIHLYDGKHWSQLALRPDVTKLVKRLPAAMT